MAEPQDRSKGRWAGIDWRMLAPILLGCLAVQTAVPLTRIATSYQAIGIDLPASSIAMLSASFSFLPVFFAVGVGRFNDRGGTGVSAVLGALVVAAAIAGLLLTEPSLWSLLVFSCILGIGQVLVVSALQISVTYCSGPARRDAVLGNFTVAMAGGQFLGPLLLGMLAGGATQPPIPVLLSCTLGVSGALILIMLVAAVRIRTHKGSGRSTEVIPVSSILRRGGLIWLVLGSGFVVTVNDLTLVYLPLLGVERGLDVGVVGLFLSVRAATSMVSRLMLVQFVALLGRHRLLVASLLVGAVSMAGIAIPLPHWALLLALALSGFAMGLAGATSLSLTLNIAPHDARATALSLRLTANRLGQFLIPVSIGPLAVFAGAGGIFYALTAILVGASATIRTKVRPMDEADEG